MTVQAWTAGLLFVTITQLQVAAARDMLPRSLEVPVRVTHPHGFA